MILSKESLGISFWDERVDILYLRRYLGKTTIVKRFSMPFVYGVNREEFEKEVSVFVKANRLQGMMACVAIPRKEVVLLNLELPANVEENLGEVIGYELDNYTPFSADTAYFDFQKLGYTPEGGKIKILLGAIEKARFHYYLDLLTGVGLKPISVEISSTAITGTIPSDSLRGINVVFYMGTNTCELSFFNEKNLNHSIPFNRPRPDPESGSGDAGRGQLVDIIQKEYRRLVSSDIDEQEVKKVVVLGDGMLDEGFLKDISNATGKEAVMIKAFEDMDMGDGADTQLQRAALGCGLRAINGDAAAINFLPVKADMGKPPAILRFAAIILFVFLASLWGGEFILRIKKETKTLNEIEEKMMLLEKEFVSVGKLKNETISMEERIPQINNFSKRRALFLSIFKELTDVIPSDTYLTMLKYRDDEVEIVGRSASAVSLLSLLEASPVFKDVEFSATVRRRGALREMSGRGAVIAGMGREDMYLENFSIKAKLEGI